MAREFLVHKGIVHSEAGFLFGSSEAFLLLCMIVVSLSIISMVIFACGDSNSGGANYFAAVAFLSRATFIGFSDVQWGSAGAGIADEVGIQQRLPSSALPVPT
ncbi:hypothetical protein DKX38_017112 [Salix brachista]|uniref:Uncharacterized protein n=1 Tax=Salix brachista TaxID=2182728 RepID=A0A5N5KVK1_9ROSI|nr:hypothetical protein DKX38_017112 [Salix brachista]